MVVGVTDEPESMVAKDIEKKKMKFPVACAVGSDFDQRYGIRGFLSSFLIDADGFVVWSGHPGNFDEDLLEQHLAKVQPVPELPEAHADIAEHFANRQYGKAQRVYQELLGPYAGVSGAEAAKPALDELKKIKDAKEELAAADKLDAAVEQFRKGDLAKAAKAFASIAKKYADTPSGERAGELADQHPLD